VGYQTPIDSVVNCAGVRKSVPSTPTFRYAVDLTVWLLHTSNRATDRAGLCRLCVEVIFVFSRSTDVNYEVSPIAIQRIATLPSVSRIQSPPRKARFSANREAETFNHYNGLTS